MHQTGHGLSSHTMDGRQKKLSRRQRQVLTQGSSLLLPVRKGPSRAKQAALSKALAPEKQLSEIVVRAMAANRKRHDDVNNASKSRSPTVQALAKALALPHDSLPQRWGGAEFANSAVAKLPTTYPVPWGTGPVGTPSIPITDMQCFLFRDPLRSFIYHDPNTADAVYTYNMVGVDTEEIAEWNGLGACPDIDLKGSRAVAANAYRPHGPFMYPGQGEDGDQYWWLESGGSVTIVTTVGAATTLTVTLVPLEAEEDGKTLSDTAVIAAAGSTSKVITYGANPGYYKLLISSSASTSLVVTSVSFSSRNGVNNHGVWCHRSAPGVDSSLTAFGAVRVTAASVLVTNIATLVNRGGAVVARQVPIGHDWTDFVAFNGTSNASLVSQGSDYYAGDFADGVYGFSSPTGPNDWMMHPYISSDEGSLTMCAFDLDRQHPVVCVAITLEAAAVGNTLITVTHHVEFQTDSPIFELDRSRVTSLDRDQVMLIAGDIPQFSENPLHFGQIMDSIRNGMRAAAKGTVGFLSRVPGYAGTAVKGAAAMLPVAAALAALL